MIPSDHTQAEYFPEAALKSRWKVSKYTLPTVVYFFFNSLALPKGLLYTNVFSPYFFYRLLINGQQTYVKQFAAFLLIYDCVHLAGGPNLASFVLSNVLFVSTYFSVIAFFHFVNNSTLLAVIYRQILVLNFVFTLVAIPFFFMEPSLQDWFWWTNRAAISKHEFPRLKLFTYEASYYSLLLVPIVYYYVMKALFGWFKRNKYLTLFMVLAPLILSMSLGVIGATVLTAAVLGLVFWKRLLSYKRAFFVTLTLLVVALSAALIILFLFPDSPLSMRLVSITDGTDTSTKGRTTDSFGLAWLIASEKNPWVGIGLGQIKIEIEALVREHYNYWGNYMRYDIPNAMGETLAIFGLSGVVLRVFLEWYLFFKTRTYTNYYRLALFIFVFIYQFTGSYITNIVEYSIWILAFSNVFEQFNINARKKSDSPNARIFS